MSDRLRPVDYLSILPAQGWGVLFPRLKEVLFKMGCKKGHFGGYNIIDNSNTEGRHLPFALLEAKTWQNSLAGR